MSESQPTNASSNDADEKPVDSFANFIQAAGTILAISYPVLALSTGYRAVYRLFFKEAVTETFGPTMTLVAATCYLTATVGIVYREKWGKPAWWLSVGVLGFETSMTLIIGTLSITHPELVGSTAWRMFGADYGYFPLFQPLLGLAWLFNAQIRASYGFKASSSHAQSK